MTSGWVARVVCTGLVQRKLLRVDLNTLADERLTSNPFLFEPNLSYFTIYLHPIVLSLSMCSSGKIINLVSNDMTRFDVSFPRLHFVWTTPLDLIVITALMVSRVGWLATFAGVAIIIFILTIPLQIFLGHRFAIQRKKTTMHTDERVRLTGEIFKGITTVKTSVWEKPFAKLMTHFRNLERRSIFIAFSLNPGKINELCAPICYTLHFDNFNLFSILGDR